MDIEQFYLGNTFFLETKRNIIIDGYFTKIIYSNDLFSMNGIYLRFPVEGQTVDKRLNKNVMRLYSCIPANAQLIHDFSKFEFKIIEYYRQMKSCTKKPSYIFAKQLFSGFLKIYKEYNVQDRDNDPDMYLPEYYVKIAGIWETNDEVGITYKMIEL